MLNYVKIPLYINESLLFSKKIYSANPKGCKHSYLLFILTMEKSTEQSKYVFLKNRKFRLRLKSLIICQTICYF